MVTCSHELCCFSCAVYIFSVSSSFSVPFLNIIFHYFFFYSRKLICLLFYTFIPPPLLLLPTPRCLSQIVSFVVIVPFVPVPWAYNYTQIRLFLLLPLSVLPLPSTSPALKPAEMRIDSDCSYFLHFYSCSFQCLIVCWLFGLSCSVTVFIFSCQIL